mgnify:CR=1 FL=1|jgi:hypothetical protein|nr:MAG TPA: hypothetical protein [Caudoviricetes sp.]
MKIDKDILGSLLYFADSIKIDGKHVENPTVDDVEKSKTVQIVNENHCILIMQDDNTASIAIMKGYNYRDSFIAVFLYKFGMGNIEISEQGKLVDKAERLDKEAFMARLKEEGVPYIAL